MARPPVYGDGLFEISIDPFKNSLDTVFNYKILLVNPASFRKRATNGKEELKMIFRRLLL
jgi:hypothetical protein